MGTRTFCYAENTKLIGVNDDAFQSLCYSVRCIRTIREEENFSKIRVPVLLYSRNICRITQ